MTVRPLRHHPRPTRRQAAAALALAGGLAAAAAVVTSGGAGAAGSPGPIATAQARDLRVTDEETGTLGRADSTTVVYDGTGGRVGGGPAGSAPVVGQSTGTAVVADLAAAPSQACGAPSSTSSTSPTSSTSSTSTSSTSTSSTATTTCPSTTTTSRPPATTTTVPATLPPLAPPADEPPGAGGDEPEDGGGLDQGGPGPTGGELPADRPDGSDVQSPSEGGPSATLTEVLPIGQAAGRGTVLYRADDEPIAALLAADPLFRDLSVDTDDGPDVAALEANLVELGYGSGLTVDERYDAATAAAVTAWEEDLGRAGPDGVVTVGEVVFLEEPTTVLGHEAQVGDLLEPGDAVLELGAESRVVELDVLAEEVRDWPAGTAVALDWGDGTTGSGTITEVARDVVDGEVVLVVSLAPGDGQERPVGSRVGVVRTVAQRDGALAVPVAAVVEGDGGPAVRVVGAGADTRRPVELGIVEGGWVEVTSGLEPGDEVRLPG